MAYTTINKSSAHFLTKDYTGNGGSLNVTGMEFQPDFCWLKCKTIGYHHAIFDSQRGATKRLRSNDTNTEETSSGEGITSFNSDGFTVAQGSTFEYGNNGVPYASWNWKAGTTGSGTTTGSGYGKAYSYSVNTTAGFSIIKYVGNGTAGHTIPHHLGATPSLIIVKNRDTALNWSVYHKKSFSSQSSPGVLYLNTTAGPANDVNVWGNSSVTIDSTVFSLGDYTGTNTNNQNHIAYVFAEKDGYSKAGKFTGTSTTNFVYTGFAPEFVIAKSTATDWWSIQDNVRVNNDGTSKLLFPQATSTETTGVGTRLLSNGFLADTTNTGFNNSSYTTYYFAIGQTMVGTNDTPATGRF